MTTLAIDVGDNIVGVLSARERYTPYRGTRIATALRRISQADVIITYNGKHYDLDRLGTLAGVQGSLPLRGEHRDMRSICWSDRILGSDLVSTYKEQFGGDPPDFPDKDEYERDNHRDCYMAWKLYQAWEAGELRIVDGARVKRFNLKIDDQSRGPTARSIPA